MTGEVPRFLDAEPSASARQHADVANVAGQSTPVIETPVLLDAQQDAREAIGADWSSRHIATRRAPRGSVAYAAAGLAIILTSWLLLSVLVSVVRFFDMSISLGSVALALYVAGSALVTYAGAGEWRPLRNLHEVDALRAVFANAAGGP